MNTPDSLEPVKCNLCGNDDYLIKHRPLVSEFDPNAVFSASGGVRGTQQIVECRSCGLVYVNPRVKNSIVVEAYADAVDELYVSQEEGRLRTFAGSFRLMEQYVGGKGKILDVGAAGGFFLKVAKDKGWETYGVEPSCWMADWGNKRYQVNIKPGLLREAAYPSDYFDVVTMWDVLEHTSDPLGELGEVRRILKPGGIVIINFPDVGSWPAKLSGRHWWFFLSVHLYYFTRDTMGRFLGRAGFSPLTFRPHIQRLDLEHLIKMVGLYHQALSDFGLKIVRLFKIEHWQIPYYAAQTNVIARKL